MGISFPGDYLHGDFLNSAFAIPTFTAQQTALSHGLTEEDVKCIQSIVWAGLLEWVAENTPSLLPIVREYSMDQLIVDSHFWGELNVEIVDIIDAIVTIQDSNGDSLLLGEAFYKLGHEKVYAALILLGAEVASKKPVNKFKLEFLSLASMVNKCYTQLTILEDGPFMHKKQHLNEIKAVQKMLAQGNQYMGESGGKGKGKSYEPIRELLQKLINERRPASMTEAAGMFLDEVIEFDRNKKCLFCKTEDKYRAVYNQISKLNNDKRLFKVFTK